MLCKAISYFYITCKTARIPKRLHLSQISGNTSLCDHHHMSIIPTIDFGLNTTEGPHPHQCLACFDENGLFFWRVTTLSGYIWMYTSVHLDVFLWWGIHGLCILWNSFILRCESITYLYVPLSHLRSKENQCIFITYSTSSEMLTR